jgi:hypothetical protein
MTISSEFWLQAKPSTQHHVRKVSSPFLVRLKRYAQVHIDGAASTQKELSVQRPLHLGKENAKNLLLCVPTGNLPPK